MSRSSSLRKYAPSELNVRTTGPGLSLGPLTFLRGPGRRLFSGRLWLMLRWRDWRPCRKVRNGDACARFIILSRRFVVTLHRVLKKKKQNIFASTFVPRVVGNYTAAMRSGSGEIKRITEKRNDFQTYFQYFSMLPRRLFLTILPVNRRGARAFSVVEQVVLNAWIYFVWKNGGVRPIAVALTAGSGGNNDRFENTHMSFPSTWQTAIRALATHVSQNEIEFYAYKSIGFSNRTISAITDVTR